MFRSKAPPITIELGREKPGDTGVRPLTVLLGVAKSEDLAISRLKSYFAFPGDQSPPHTAWLRDERNVLISRFQIDADGRVSRVASA